MFRDMRGTLERVAVDIAGEGGVGVDKTGRVIDEGLERDSGRSAVEELSLAQIRFQRGGEIGRRSAERCRDLRFPADARIEDLGLRDLDAGAEIHLVASVFAIEPRRCTP